MMPLRYECKVAFLMVRQQLSKPRQLTATEARRLSKQFSQRQAQRLSSCRPNSTNNSTDGTAATEAMADDAPPMLREGDPAPPSAIRFLSTSVVFKIFRCVELTAHPPPQYPPHTTQQQKHPTPRAPVLMPALPRSRAPALPRSRVHLTTRLSPPTPASYTSRVPFVCHPTRRL